ncbi:hypothetical protein, partial [Pseudoalteromonas sp. '520P1 No. 412']
MILSASIGDEFLARDYSFCRTSNGKGQSFIRTYDKEIGRFTIKFEVWDMTLQHLPLVSVEEMPDELKKEKLPHLSAGR